MNLKTKLIGFAIAAAVCLGIAAPAGANHDPLHPQTNLTVNFTDDGVFTVALNVPTGGGFAPQNVNATTGVQTLTGSIQLLYTDTKAYRSQFRVELQATDFVSSLQVPYAPANTFYTIPATGLKLVKNYNPGQIRWSSQGCTSGFPGPGCTWAYRVGDIGATDQGGTSIGSAAPGYATWTANNTLNVARKVTQAWAGSGTVGTSQLMDLSLLVPAAMPGVTYTSQMTATVIGETP